MRILVLASWVTNVFDENGSQSLALKARYPECSFRFLRGDACTQEDVCWADVITGHPQPRFLKAATRLRWLHLQSAGVNGYEDRAIYGNPETIVTRAAGVHGPAIAEHALALALALNRRLPELHASQLQGRWQHQTAHYELQGATVLMLGMGYLAAELVRYLRGFDCRVIGVRRDAGKPVPPGYDAVYPSAALPELLPQADYLFNTLPLTPSTRGLLGREAFRLAKPRLILVNVGRGATVDTDALFHALEEGRIAGAGLDVTEPEPLPPDSPLWTLPNVLITPHCSAWSDATDLRRGAVFMRQLDKFLAGEPLDAQIDFSAGY